MKPKRIACWLLIFMGITAYSQQSHTDSISDNIIIDEIIITRNTKSLHQKQVKSLSTLDEFLEKSSKINMVKRGGYAWEPFINNMATERTIITIDGMRIFGACTDKMDPITSYVEVSNLSKAEVVSGQQGNTHGATIGGALDLKRSTVRNNDLGWKGRLISGYETNNQQKIIGVATAYNDSLFYAHTDFMYRDAGNYKAGKNKEVAFSQFTKYNVSGTFGYFLNQRNLVEASVIYDKATDVGYPALPMDVSLAEALITSLKYELIPISETIENWETKLYYNSITHTMDDTKRPNVPIHMDMPGWSDTYGMYSKVKGTHEKHQFSVNLNAFYNKSVAEMTMYPNDPNENLMFMYTWPDIRTLYSGLFVGDTYRLNENNKLKFSANIGFHSNKVADDFGLSSLQIFYPEMDATKSRLLKSFSGNYLLNQQKWNYNFGIAYGERAPSVSEGYGFYLYNSNDFYDYVGNPYLSNEKSWETNASVHYHSNTFHSKLSASYFHIQNYIVGKVDQMVLPMTIGATGIKRYSALDYATILSADYTIEYHFLEHYKMESQLVYSYGKGSDSNVLPFISPFRYALALSYSKDNLLAQITANGNTKHTNYAPFYGENKTNDYIVFGLNTGYLFLFEKTTLNLKAGVENILDRYYSTFSDWNNISRIGRNVYLNLEFVM